jgi:hypothetical protein
MHQADARAQALTLPGGQLPGPFAQHLQFATAGSQGGGQQVEQARLAGAGRADDRHLFVGPDVQVDAAQGMDAVAVGQADATQVQCHLSRSAARAASSMPL